MAETGGSGPHVEATGEELALGLMPSAPNIELHPSRIEMTVCERSLSAWRPPNQSAHRLSRTLPLHFSGSNLEWVVNAYAVAFGGLLVNYLSWR
jgi:hypothetical protein